MTTQLLLLLRGISFAGINFYKDSVSKEEYEEMIENTSHYSNCFDGYQGEYYFDEEHLQLLMYHLHQ